MKKLGVISILILALALSGCMMRTYKLTRDRVDQDMSGNRGYVTGQPAPAEDKQLKTTRDTRVLEFEFGFLRFFHFSKKPKKGKISLEEIEKQVAESKESLAGQSDEAGQLPEGSFEKYTVQKNDTLQKISQKFYGTSKKWKRIFNANKEKLSAPNKVYPGQVLNIPTAAGSNEPLKETEENLK